MKVFGSSLTRVLAGIALGLVCGVSGVAYAGIAATKHNLSSSGTGSNHTTGTDQICVFCHTPHGSDTSAAVPLWNRVLGSQGAAYQVYNSVSTSQTSTIDGTIAPVGSVSIACLSCHDGTQAMDNVLNKPGSGGYSGTGSAIGGTWTGSATMSGTPIPVLGTDLTNDHPIGIQYCGGGLTGAAGTVSGSCADADFVSGSAGGAGTFAGYRVLTKDVNSSPVFWVETGGDTTRNKTDISLYARSEFTGPSVECGSCHDPHVESIAGQNIMFMRVTTAGSAICLSCHVK